ncbi:MAG: tRNA (adenosine(37)-N6)-dimethylallyltransferase MiaA [Chlamydiae bacterium]|nr:tRNA (adenosine(37)-N6)-dimethylallyltransferase MiaA [Chlamydiota bacterium]
MTQDCINWQVPLEKKEPREKGFKKKKVLVIAGPTATGKTELSIRIANGIGAEIISCDSMQVYKWADIGSAKPSKQELKAVYHHLIDIRDIREPFNVADFYEEATSALEDIMLRNKVPITVGGAGFYVHTFLYGPPKGPPSNKEIRAKLEADIEKFGVEMLYGKLQELDPDYAKCITVQDRHKIVRALEIILLTGKKVSEIPKPSEEDLSRELDFRCWFIYYPKPILYERIEKRCDQMIQQGLLDEVIKLREGLKENSAASNAIGYRQAIKYLDSPKTKADFDHFVSSFKQASRNYAKRQFTWFRREPLFRWLDLSLTSIEGAAEIIIRDLEQN